MTIPTKPTVFVSYSHKDEPWKDRLMAHLEVLSQQGLLNLWEDRLIGAGEDWYQKIEDAMKAASVAILLVSANSLTSKFILREEVSKLLQRRDKEGLLILPVIVKSCPWKQVAWLSRLQVRPTDGKPLASYGGNRRDEALSNIATEVYQQFKTAAESISQKKIEQPERKIYIKEADILDFRCDVVVFKYAQAFYGAEAVAATRLKERSANYPEISPKSDKFVLLPSKRQLAAKNALFVGVPELGRFAYKQIREFAARSMKILSSELPGIQHVAMTMHGVGYGLDERESFLAQVGGLIEAFISEDVPHFLERVTIVERNPKRADRLREMLKEHVPTKFIGATSRGNRSVLSKPASEAGVKSSAKPHIFVAIPYEVDMEDVYIFGIKTPVNEAGYLCERVDVTEFSVDLLARVKSRIATASLLVAEVSSGNPVVYWQVGYAWGKDTKTLLLAKKGAELRLDTPGQRLIIYKSLIELSDSLKKELGALRRRTSGSRGLP